MELKILGPIKIGNNTKNRANAVVNKTVPDNVTVGRILRRNSKSTISQNTEIKMKIW